MTEMTVSFSKKRFNEIGTTLASAIRYRVKNGQPIDQASMLEALSQSVWNKSYSEIREAILVDHNNESSVP